MENNNIKRKNNNKTTKNVKKVKKSQKKKIQGKVLEVSVGKILKKIIVFAIIIYGVTWVYDNRDRLNNGNNNSNIMNQSSNFSSNNSEFSDLNLKDENDVFALYANDYVGIWQKYFLDQTMPDYELNIISIEDKKVTFNLNYYRIAQFRNQVANLDGNIATFETVLNEDSSNLIIGGKITFENDKIKVEVTKSEFEDLVPRETISFDLKANESKLE